MIRKTLALLTALLATLAVVAIPASAEARPGGQDRLVLTLDYPTDGPVAYGDYALTNLAMKGRQGVTVTTTVTCYHGISAVATMSLDGTGERAWLMYGWGNGFTVTCYAQAKQVASNGTYYSNEVTWEVAAG